MLIEPDGFVNTHKRGGVQHRLNADQSKWQPLGIGTPDRPVLENDHVKLIEKDNHEAH